MPNQTNYKTLAWVFGILALLFAVLFFTKANPEVKSSVDDATAKIETCRRDLAKWQLENKNSTSSESRDSLSLILAECSDNVGNATTE